MSFYTRVMGLLSALRGGTGGSAADAPLPADLRESLTSLFSSQVQNEQLLSERIAELELALEDIGWQRIVAGGTDFEFSDSALKRIIHLSRLYALKNPVIKRPVNLQAIYVFGQGFSIHAEDPEIDEVVQGFLADRSNRRTFTALDSCLANERRLRTDGNLFLRFFSGASGRTTVRVIPVEQILDGDIYRNPEDASEPWFYLRRWRDPSGEEHLAAYPDIDYLHNIEVEKRARTSAPEMMRDEAVSGVAIDWETPVMHIRTGGYAEMKFGIPETYAALDWARAYKELLEDFKKIVKSLAKWAWDLKSGSDQASVNAAKAMLESTIGGAFSTDETNPAPAAGSTFIRRDGIELKAIDVSRAIIDPETFNRVMLMVCSAMDTPSNFFGDAASGNLASAKTLDRPTELTFRARQQLWADIFERAVVYAIERAAESPSNTKIKSNGYDEMTGLMKVSSGGKQLDDIDLNVDFPPILQKDAQSEVQALITGITANGQSLQIMNDGPTILRIFLEDLGIKDIDEIIELFYPSDGSEPKARPIETFEAPKTPAQRNSELSLSSPDDQDEPPASASAPAPLGNQPTAQGPAGSANAGRQNRGGPNSRVAPERRQESEQSGGNGNGLLSEEAKARIHFMNTMIAAIQDGGGDGSSDTA